MDRVAYGTALAKITNARCGWVAYGWYEHFRTALAEHDLIQINRQFNIIAMERGWDFRVGTKRSYPVDPRFADILAGANAPRVVPPIIPRRVIVPVAEWTVAGNPTERPRRVRWNAAERKYVMLDAD